MSNSFISVGIDVGADFSFMSLAQPNQTLIGKPFKIVHNNFYSLEKAVETIKAAEETYTLKVRIVMESTGIYHFPLYCYLKDKGFDVIVINPIISKNSSNMEIRQVKNDKMDSKKLALIGLKPDLKKSVIPPEKVMNLRNLEREYYNLTDSRSEYVIKLKGLLRLCFPQYLGVFSKITIQTSLTLLEKYPSPQELLSAEKDEVIEIIRKTARFGKNYAEKKYSQIIKAAGESQTFGYYLSSHSTQIKMFVAFIKKFDEEISEITSAMHKFVKENADEIFVKQIHLLETIPGVGFLSAVTVICEIGDFSVFKSPKQLLAYFGIDPTVKKSGNFQGTNMKMSKRGSSVARRAIFTIAMVGVSIKRNGIANNPILRDYYLNKCKSKLKMVALGACMHKICNIIFAVLRDMKAFEIITPEKHISQYQEKLAA